MALHLPMAPSTIHFTLMKPLPSERSDKLITRLSPGVSKLKTGKTTIYIYKAPAIPEDVSSIICLLPTPFFNAGRDTVNPKGILAYNYMSTVICIFLRVHSYSAFYAEDKESILLLEQLVGRKLGSDYQSKARTDKPEDKEKQSDLNISEKF